ncbi:hypothetical protein KEM54_002251 [Ascosphaera aggregata]|nr:hypothetical protein KEM54_002251 [Ascosphaera aggregata]
MFPSAVRGIGDSLRQRICRPSTSFTTSSLSTGLGKSDRSSDSSSKRYDLPLRAKSEKKSTATPVSGDIPQDVLLARAEMEGNFQKARLQLMNQYIHRKIHTRTNLAACASSYSDILDSDFCRRLLRVLKAAAIRIDALFERSFKSICMRSRYAEAKFRRAKTAEDIEKIVHHFEKHVRKYEARRRFLIQLCLEHLAVELNELPLDIDNAQWARLIGVLYFVTPNGRYRPARPIARRTASPSRPPADAAPRLSLNFEAPGQENSAGPDGFLAELNAAISRVAESSSRQELRPLFGPLLYNELAAYWNTYFAEHDHRHECQAVASGRRLPQSMGHSDRVVHDDQLQYFEFSLPVRSRPQPRNHTDQGPAGGG